MKSSARAALFACVVAFSANASATDPDEAAFLAGNEAAMARMMAGPGAGAMMAQAAPPA